MEKDIIEKITAIEETLKYHTKMIESLVFNFDSLFKKAESQTNKMTNITEMIKENPLFKDNPQMASMFNSIVEPMLASLNSDKKDR